MHHHQVLRNSTTVALAPQYNDKPVTLRFMSSENGFLSVNVEGDDGQFAWTMYAGNVVEDLSAHERVAELNSNQG